MENKKGATFTIGIIVALVLGVALIVILILGFTIGFSKILPFLSSDNVDSIVNGCNSACATKSVYGFCTQQRQLIDAEGTKVTASCHDFSNGTYPQYGINNCSFIDCPTVQASPSE